MLQNARPMPQNEPENEEQPRKLNEQTERLLQSFRAGDAYGRQKGESSIHVNSVVSRMASFYEKIRNAIDYRDEQLLRKNAIERILKRRLALGRRESIARHIIRELIQARYLPNDRIPESRVGIVRAVIDRYLYCIDQIPPTQSLGERGNVARWLLGIASVEIEDILAPSAGDDAIVEYAYRMLQADVVFADESITEQEQHIQVYLAIHRALLKSDRAILSYHLFLHYYPGWRRADQALAQDVAQHVYQIRNAIEGHLAHRMGLDLQRRFKRYMMLFHVLKDVIEEDAGNARTILEHPERLRRAIIDAASVRYKRARGKLWGRISRSMVYILITKSILAFIVEIPYEVYFLGAINWLALGINILFFPFLLLMMAVTIRVPAQKNTERIIYGVTGLLYTDRNPQLFAALRRPIRRSPLMTTGFRLFYLVTFLLTFGLIIWGLRQLDFNVVSVALFLFFLSIVSFVGIRIRIITQELVVVAQRESGLSILVDFFTLPIISVGRWIAEKAPRVNVIVFLMDFIIEAPFKISIQFIEDWVAFMREKKEEIY